MHAALNVPTINRRQRIPQAAIDDVVEQIVARFHLSQIILFGSYARGAYRPESDVDLLTLEWVEKAEGDYATALRELRARKAPMVRPDLIRLDRYAVRFRYPGECADREEARFALRSAEAVRQFGRAKLGLTI